MLRRQFFALKSSLESLIPPFHKRTSFSQSIFKLLEEEKERQTMVNERKHQRYNGKFKKRQWQARGQEEGESETKRERPENFERIKRKKSVILMGYCGKNYLGMQRNRGMATIEEELLKAMLKHKWITEEAFETPQSVSFQRGSRTDKGVSAARQCVSLKLPETLDIPALNADLPEDIKVFGVKRVTKGFNSKDQCDSRTYTYTLPTLSFAKHETWETINKTEFRMPKEDLEKVNSVLKLYEGTRNFHNFTSRKHFNDPSSKRVILSFECEEPFLVKDVEFAKIKIRGQSFMMHQIRKMIGLSLAIIRGLTDTSVIDKALTNINIDIPTAPGLGLVLDQLHYDRYNNRYGDDGVHATLEWPENEAEIEEFYKAKIIPTIYETEIQENSMWTWLENLSRHTYAERDPNLQNPEKEVDSNQNQEDDDE